MTLPWPPPKVLPACMTSPLPNLPPPPWWPTPPKVLQACMAEAPGGRPLDAAGLLEFPWFSAAAAAAAAAAAVAAAAAAAAPATVVVTAAVTVTAVTAAAALVAADVFSGPLLPLPLLGQ